MSFSSNCKKLEFLRGGIDWISGKVSRKNKMIWKYGDIYTSGSIPMDFRQVNLMGSLVFVKSYRMMLFTIINNYTITRVQIMEKIKILVQYRHSIKSSRLVGNPIMIQECLFPVMAISEKLSNTLDMRDFADYTVFLRYFCVTLDFTKITTINVSKPPNSLFEITQVLQKVVYLSFDCAIFSKNQSSFCSYKQIALFGKIHHMITTGYCLRIV